MKRKETAVENLWSISRVSWSVLLVNPYHSNYPKLPFFPSSMLGMTPFIFNSQVPVGLPLSFMGYGAVVPGGYGVSYNPTPDEIIFCICRWISYRHEFLNVSCFAKLLYCFCFWAKLFSPQTFEIHQFPLVSWNKQQKVRRHTATVSSGLISYKCTQFLMLLHAILLESIQYRFPGHAATLHQMTPRLFFYTVVSIAAAVHNGSSHQFWFCQLLHFC